MVVMKLLREAKIAGKTVLVRGDLDVKLDPLDDFRLKKLLPTLELLVQEECKIILAGHNDRPKGKVVEELRVKPIANWLKTCGFKVKYTGEILPTQQPSREDFTGKVILRENLRFDPREEKNDQGFARELANLADIYVNEAFAVSHREHASMVGITKFLPSYAGLHLQKEVTTLAQILSQPARPLVFVMGGAKSETKIPLVKSFAKIADTILLGGTLMFAQTLEGVPKVRFAMDAVQTFDIGPKTIALFTDYIRKAGTIVWNGPLGKFEDDQFASGTAAIAQAILNSSASQVVIGGGDTIDALKKLDFLEKAQSHPRISLSSGGGAMLTFLAQQKMPALEALGFVYPA